jgi:hypothetical protein
MKNFILREAKEGRPVCTSNGNDARIVAFDFVGPYPIVALVSVQGKESVCFFDLDGNIKDPPSDSGWNLMMRTKSHSAFAFVLPDKDNVPSLSKMYSDKGEANGDRNKAHESMSEVTEIKYDKYE